MNAVGDGARIIDQRAIGGEHAYVAIIRLMTEPFTSWSLLTPIKTFIGICNWESIDEAASDTFTGSKTVGEAAIASSGEAIVALCFIVTVAIHEEHAKVVLFIPSEVGAE